MGKLATIKIELDDENFQLEDVFYDGFYLELGKIDDEIIKDLLAYKAVKYNDITYFDIENTGIGSFDLHNKELNNKLPFYYFENIVRKNELKQLFITYGLCANKGEYKETFLPIILIPVNLYFDKEDISVQMIAPPIPNPKIVLPNTINAEKLDTIYDLDNFCFRTKKIMKSKLYLENFITMADVTTSLYTQGIDTFKLSNLKMADIKSGFNLCDKADICQISSLDETQRIALEKANFKNNFAINGICGTGKTTTLCNIAANAIYHDKKVLYISNVKETREQVYNTFSSLHLEPFILDLSKSFATMSEKYDKNVDVNINKVTKIELQANYDGIYDYVDLLYQKINDFRFISILKGSIEYRTCLYQFIENIRDEIGTIYRLELEKIEPALKIIDDNINKLPAFRECKFIDIPIKNEYSSIYVLNVLNRLSYLYGEAINVKNELILKYGFAPIASYAYFRNVISNYKVLTKSKVPAIWLEFASVENKDYTFVYYEKAKDMLDIFQAEVINASQQDEILGEFYNTENIYTYDIKRFFELVQIKQSNVSLEEIDIFLSRTDYLLEKAENMEEVISNTGVAFGNLKYKLKFDINYENDSLLKNLSDFILFFKSHKIPKAWLNTNNLQGIRKKIISLESKLNEYYRLLLLYQDNFTNRKDLNQNIKALRKKISKNSTKYDTIEYQNLLKDLEKLSAFKNEQIEMNEYKVLTNASFETEVSALPFIDSYIGKINSIKNIKLVNKFIKSNGVQDTHPLYSFILPLIRFCEGYKEINDFFDELYQNKLVSTEDNENLSLRIKAIQKAKKYLYELVSLQHQMINICKSDDSYIKYNDYLVLDKRMEELELICRTVQENKTYKLLYGDMFNGYKSNIVEVRNQINLFGSYISIFKNNKFVKHSFNFSTNIAIMNTLNQSFGICEEITNLIRQQNKIFKKNDSAYYYNDMSDVVRYVNDLCESKDELFNYLKIIQAFKTLSNYKLNNFITFLKNNKVYNIHDHFMYTYYNCLYNKFVQQHPEMINSEGAKQLIIDAIKNEELYLKNNVLKLQKKIPNHYSITPSHNFNYQQLFEKTKDFKQLYLCDSKTLHYHLNPDDFDLILVDDAQTLKINQYDKMLRNRQLIIAGNNGIRVSIYNNLFSIVKREGIIDFKYRYTTTPASLAANITRAKCSIYSAIENNEGIEITKDKDDDLIIKLLVNDKHIKNIKINYYTNSVKKVKDMYTKLAHKLSKLGFMEAEIQDILLNKLNICPLEYEFDVESDYNIINISAYFKEDNYYAINNYMSYLMTCRNKLYIIDSNDYIEKKSDLPFIKNISTLIEKKPIATGKLFDTLLIMSTDFTKAGIKVIGKYADCSLLLSYNNKYLAILLCNAATDYDNDILNNYRRCVKGNIPISIVLIHDLAIDYQNVMKKLVETIYEQSR